MASGSGNLVLHLERFLGEMAIGWNQDPEGRRLPFQVVRFPDWHKPEVAILTTLGLSHHELSRTDGSTRQELLLAVDSRFGNLRSVQLLVVVGEMLLKAHEALALGDVIRGAGDILDRGEKTALYAATPTFLPDDFAVFVASEPPTEFVWLVPITGGEADLVDSHGRDWFEGRLLQAQPNLFDLARSPIPHD
jgi:hypothetical protein